MYLKLILLFFIPKHFIRKNFRHYNKLYHFLLKSVFLFSYYSFFKPKYSIILNNHFLNYSYYNIKLSSDNTS
jgi:hypothetical protein